jgi:hypothetical protein
VFQVQPDFGPATLVNLASGAVFEGVTEAQALPVAQDYAKQQKIAGIKPTLQSIDIDQWTVQSGYDADRPMYQVALNDSVGTQLYVSSSTG